MQSTSWFQKLSASAVNVMVVLVIFMPFYFLLDSTLVKKLVLIALFFLYNVSFLFSRDKRCLGMRAVGTSYEKSYSKWQRISYNLLYTLSFSTLLFWIWLPFDLFLLNMLFLQLPVRLAKKTTLHGYLAGDIRTVV